MKKMNLKALIVEDDPDSMAVLHMYLMQHGGFIEILEATTAEDGLFKLMDRKPDMVFLDIQLPGKSGVDFLEVLNKYSIKPHFVIISSSRFFAADVIKFKVYDYLVKPVNKQELYSIIDNFRLILMTKSKDESSKIIKYSSDSIKIKFVSKNSYVLVDPAEIVYCQAEGKYSMIYFTNGRSEMVNAYITNVEEVLEKFGFVKTNRSTIINLKMLRSIDRSKKTCILVVNGLSFEVNAARKQILELSKNEI